MRKFEFVTQFISFYVEELDCPYSGFLVIQSDDTVPSDSLLYNQYLKQAADIYICIKQAGIYIYKVGWDIYIKQAGIYIYI